MGHIDRVLGEPIQSVFVGNLDFKATEEEVKEVFKGYEKAKVVIHKNKGGKPLGFAHVHFSSPEEAKEAAEKLKVMNIEIKGRKIRIDIAKPKKSF